MNLGKDLYGLSLSLFSLVNRPESQLQSLAIASSGSACVIIIVAAFEQCLHCLYISHLIRDSQFSACTIYVMLRLFSSY